MSKQAEFTVKLADFEVTVTMQNVFDMSDTKLTATTTEDILGRILSEVEDKLDEARVSINEEQERRYAELQKETAE